MAPSAREKCFSVNGERCYFCRSAQNIDVHFIDGNSNNEECSNLLPVCETHHAAIHNGQYRDWWEQCSGGGTQTCESTAPAR